MSDITFIYSSIPNDGKFEFAIAKRISRWCRCIAPAAVQRRTLGPSGRTKKSGVRWARPAGQSFSPAALAPSLLVPEAVEPPPGWNKSVRQLDFLKVGSFVLRTTKLRTWMAAGATHLHRPYPADSRRNRKFNILQTISGPISLLSILPSQTMGNSNLRQQREFPDGAGALHLPRSSCVSWARPAGQKAHPARQKKSGETKRLAG